MLVALSCWWYMQCHNPNRIISLALCLRLFLSLCQVSWRMLFVASVSVCVYVWKELRTFFIAHAHKNGTFHIYKCLSLINCNFSTNEACSTPQNNYQQQKNGNILSRIKLEWHENNLLYYQYKKMHVWTAALTCQCLLKFINWVRIIARRERLLNALINSLCYRQIRLKDNYLISR